MKKKWMMLLMIPAMMACTSEKQEKINALQTECIRIHDVVMPRMGEIVNLSSDIKTLRKTYESDTADSLISYRIHLMKHIQLLDSAHEEMMVWMQEYEPNFGKSNGDDATIKYYESEIQAIQRVHDLMLKSIEDGKKVLAERH